MACSVCFLRWLVWDLHFSSSNASPVCEVDKKGQGKGGTTVKCSLGEAEHFRAVSLKL